MGLSNFTSGSDTNSTNGPPPGGPPPGPPPTGTAPPSDTGDVRQLLVDYNEKFQHAEATKFREDLISQVLSVLISRDKPNVLLKGPAGVGKTKVVEDIARRIALGDALIPSLLRDHTVYEVQLTNLIASCGHMGELEDMMQELISFASDPNNSAILFMDEIHQIAGGSQSHTDRVLGKISQILKPALARGDMHLIGATTSTESRALDEDPAFARRFSHLIVDELTVEQTKEVLHASRPGLIAHYRHQIHVSDAVLAETVTIAEGHSRADHHRPDNALTLLDRAMASRVLEQNRLITQAEKDGDTALAQALRSSPQVPLTAARVLDVAKRLRTGNIQRPDFDIATLHTTLTSSLQGQEDVLDKLVDALAREDLNLFPSKAPMTWMLAGASGVGKTETAKIIAEQKTGTEPIILNMTEYHTQWETSRIIGAPPGYLGSDSNSELPFDSLESNPHRVILLDEFEKACAEVQRLFLSAFDEGYITTARGKKLDFSKALIICTTNAASEVLSEKTLGFAPQRQTISTRSLNKELLQAFDPELLGRFSLVIGFNPIDEQTFRGILTANYARQRERIVNAKPQLSRTLPTAIPDDELHAIAASTYVESQGARPAHKAVRTWIEDRLLAAQTGANGTTVPVAPALAEEPREVTAG
ncbi:AAA family ATPase [Streptomyces sp. NRRL F-5053]|uniref:AAA family ATPase n=1 Tax=Streptomyces sp. NRRL F-5053 TaxID=1463854 RepID=UPI0004CB697E|nr:AAA family ATPase [Streptomyces sp. NRRL F-5053]